MLVADKHRGCIPLRTEGSAEALTFVVEQNAVFDANLAVVLRCSNLRDQLAQVLDLPNMDSRAANWLPLDRLSRYLEE